MRAVECMNGWERLYKPFLDLAALYGVEILQVKEKFGTLRIYTAGARARELDAVVGALEAASAHICEKCGQDGYEWLPQRTPRAQARNQKGGKIAWTKTLCEPCAKDAGYDIVSA